MGRKINELEDDLVNLMPVAGDAVQLTLDVSQHSAWLTSRMLRKTWAQWRPRRRALKETWTRTMRDPSKSKRGSSSWCERTRSLSLLCKKRRSVSPLELH